MVKTKHRLKPKQASAAAVYSVPVAGAILGYSRNGSYELVKSGRFPVPVIQVGDRLKVPKAPLHKLLGIEA
jgi:hypothetical protein